MQCGWVGWCSVAGWVVQCGWFDGAVLGGRCSVSGWGGAVWLVGGWCNVGGWVIAQLQAAPETQRTTPTKGLVLQELPVRTMSDPDICMGRKPTDSSNSSHREVPGKGLWRTAMLHNVQAVKLA